MVAPAVEAPVAIGLDVGGTKILFVAFETLDGIR